MSRYDGENSFLAKLRSTTPNYSGMISTLQTVNKPVSGIGRQGGIFDFGDDGWLTVSNATHIDPPLFWFRRLNVDNPTPYYEIRLYDKSGRLNRAVDISTRHYLALYSNSANTSRPLWTLSQIIDRQQRYDNISIREKNAEKPIQADSRNTRFDSWSSYLVNYGGKTELRFELDIVRYGDTTPDANRD
ncbi:hypothetical protein D9M71_114180 [compost metagenome]